MRKIWPYPMKALVFIIFTGLFVVSAAGNYTTSDPLVYHLHYLVEIENSQYPALDYSLQFPVFLTRGLPPYQKIFSLELPKQIKLTGASQNRTAVFSVKRLEPYKKIKLEIGYTIINSAIKYSLSPTPINTGAVMEPGYLKPEDGIESNNGRIVSLAQNLTLDLSGPLEKAKRLFEYVNANLGYRPQSSAPHSALRTLERGGGSCEDYSLLYIALCRAAGIPARYVSGYRFEPREIGKNEIDLDQFAHAWVEVYLPDTGWITVDPTFSYSINGFKKVNFNFFGQILPDDRHLFFSYTRRLERTVRWNYQTSQPARVNTGVHIFISRR